MFYSMSQQGNGASCFWRTYLVLSMEMRAAMSTFKVFGPRNHSKLWSIAPELITPPHV